MDTEKVRVVIPEPEFLSPGMYSCPGCMAALAMRHVLKGMGPNTIIALTTGCWAVIDGPFPYTSVKVPLLHGAFGTAASMARGLRASLDIQGKEDVQVLAWGGDGATFDIGMTALSAAAAYNENVLYVCYDNEAYMNTGGQLSTATLPGMKTTTTTESRLSGIAKKNIVEIMAAHGIPYAATASVAYPHDLLSKVQAARALKGFKFIHVHSPCPTGWRTPPDQGVHMGQLAVKTRLHPLYHVLDGHRYFLDLDPEPLPVRAYYDPQKSRMLRLTEEEMAAVQAGVNQRWQTLSLRCQQTQAGK
jgi:pyruvate ferredoxin oxidoreductase beta subunit/2-oxoisovalerate ferredoxin oxidoreductase beta subunit